MQSTSATRENSLLYPRGDLTADYNRWGPVAWIIISEVFPLGLRAKGVSLGGSSNWLNNVGDSPPAYECMLIFAIVCGRNVDFGFHRDFPIRSICRWRPTLDEEYLVQNLTI